MPRNEKRAARATGTARSDQRPTMDTETLSPAMVTPVPAPRRPSEANPASGVMTAGAIVAQGVASRGTIPVSQVQGCPLMRAALRSGDPVELAQVRRMHPPERCPTDRTAKVAA
jgi:hypothetical protein